MAEKTSFFMTDNKICEKCKQIWDAIKNKWGIKFITSLFMKKNT